MISKAIQLIYVQYNLVNNIQVNINQYLTQIALIFLQT